MSDQPTPEAQPSPEAAPATAPDATTAVAVAEPPARPADPTPAAAADPTPASSADPTPAPAAGAPRKSVQVPVWLLTVLAVLVVGVGAFFVGRETAPASDPGPDSLAEAVEMTASGELEVGEFDVRTLLQALGQNQDLDLGSLGDLILDQLDPRN